MVRIDTIKVIGLTDPQTEERIRSQLTALILSVKGTIPGSRTFGLDGEYLDYPMPAALGILAVELSEACDQWMPNLGILSVQPTQQNAATGEVRVTIEAEWKEAAV